MDNEATADRTQHSGEQRDDRLPSHHCHFLLPDVSPLRNSTTSPSRIT